MEAMAKLVEVQAIYHIDFRGTIRSNGVTYHFRGTRRWPLLVPIRFHRFLKRLKPDVVIVHGLISPWQVILLRWQLGSSLRIFIEHHAERPFRDFRAYLQRWADRYVSAYFFGSKELGKQWVEKGQIVSMDKVKEIIGTASVFYPIEAHPARVELGIRDETTFIWVGRLDENKDPRTVIRAFSNLMDEGLTVALYMIYSLSDGTISENTIANETKWIGERIFLIGEVTHERLQYWYNSANFIVSSSHYEGSGISVIEAMSCGCFPILSDIPSFRAMTNNGEIGLLYPAGDDHALRSKIRDAVNVDMSRSRQLVLGWHDRHLSNRAAAEKILSVIESTKR
jgi:glycosyltransferase involved in cell wall biosynthesis